MKDGKQRAAIGFYLCFLRLRFASSFYALRCSLERRLIKIEQILTHKAQRLTLDEEDREALEELDEDEGLVLKHRSESDLTWEQTAVEALLQRIGRTDRIGQHHQRIQVYNSLYQDSVKRWSTQGWSSGFARPSPCRVSCSSRYYRSSPRISRTSRRPGTSRAYRRAGTLAPRRRACGTDPRAPTTDRIDISDPKGARYRDRSCSQLA